MAARRQRSPKPMEIPEEESGLSPTTSPTATSLSTSPTTSTSTSLATSPTTSTATSLATSPTTSTATSSATSPTTSTAMSLATSPTTSTATSLVSSEQEAANEHVSLRWEDFFMNLAFGVSMRSMDKKSRVGCVLVSPDTLQVLSVGYNGYTRGISHNEVLKMKPKFIVHAEANAIDLKGHASLKGAFAFVTLFPCLNCAKKLIQACIRRVYFLSVRGNEFTKKSWKLLTRAEVELIPYPRKEKDGTLDKFGEVLISRLTGVYNCISSGIQEDLKKHTDTDSDFKKLERENKESFSDFLRSKWAAQGKKFPKRIKPFDLWEHWFIFLAMIAATKSSDPKRPEGCVLVDSNELKICGMSYRGYPRGIEKDDPKLKDFIKEVEVSAIANALSLKFKEGEEYYCFATHFPSNEDAKDLAQASVTRLFFICPAYEPSEPIDPHALKIFGEAEISVRVIDLKMLSMEDGDDVNRKIQETLKFLCKMEAEANTNFPWPTPETFRGLEANDEPVLSLVKPLILGGKGGIKPARY